MADWRLDQKTEETPQNSDLSMLVRGTSVFKTTFQKIKEFIIGTTSMGTTATDVTGAVKELNDKIGSEEKEGSIIASLNDMKNKINIHNFSKFIKGKKVKIIGDSLTSGVGSDNYVLDGEVIYGTHKAVNANAICWANLLKNHLISKFNCSCKNWGVGATNTTDIVNHLSDLIKTDDEVIICAIGANNCYSTTGLAKLKEDMVTINNYMKNNNKIIVYVGTIQTLNCKEETYGIKMEDIDIALSTFACENNALFIPMYKLWEDYIISNCQCDYAQLYYNDDHPNSDGYRAMFYLISNYLGLYTDLQTRKSIQKFYDTGWLKLPLGDGIISHDNPQYRRINNVIYLRGRIKGNLVNNVPLFTLPAGFRPVNVECSFAAVISNLANANLYIGKDGVGTLLSNEDCSNYILSLDCSFIRY